MRTRNDEDAGTDSLVALTIDAVQLTFFDTVQDDQERGGANVYETNVMAKNISTENLNNSSIRMAILGAVLWRSRAAKPLVRGSVGGDPYSPRP